MGIKSDGSVLVDGYAFCCGTSDKGCYEAEEWNNIISVCFYGNDRIIGLKSDGTAMITGYYSYNFSEVYNLNLFTASQTLIKGDLNEDNKVSIADLIIFAKSLSRKIELTENQKLISDLNDDGKLNGDDLLLFIKYLVGEISSFPLQR